VDALVEPVEPGHDGERAIYNCVLYRS
jgi:hypothetical protein